MAALTFFVQVAAAVMLLLFAVQTVQSGIQAQAKHTLRRVFVGRGSLAKAFLGGMLAAVLMQSATAVALLTASFSGSGLIGFSSALAAILGADLGSALVVVLLSFRLDWMVSVLLAIGGWMYLKLKGQRIRQIGKIILGIGLILLSLHLLSDAFAPIRLSPFWPEIMQVLERDLVAALLLGAGLAFAIHSSVAAVLMCVALAEVNAIPLPVGIAMILGANLGSSLIPLWLTRGAKPKVRRVLWGNAALRGTLAVLVFTSGLFLWPGPAFDVGGPSETMLLVHLGFNAMLLLCLPLLGTLGRVLERALPETALAPDDIERWRTETCLTQSPTPDLACANMRREVLRMATFLGGMVEPALTLYRTARSEDLKRLQNMDAALQDALDALRIYAADVPTGPLSKAKRREIRDLLDVAVDLSAASQIVSGRLLEFAKTVHDDRLQFSEEGWDELRALSLQVVENMTLAFGALASDDIALARSVVEAKASVRKLERRSRKQHFERLRAGVSKSFASSDVHLETLRAFKELNSKITETVYPMLTRSGQLSETRLVPQEGG